MNCPASFARCAINRFARTRSDRCPLFRIRSVAVITIYPTIQRPADITEFRFVRDGSGRQYNKRNRTFARGDRRLHIRIRIGMQTVATIERDAPRRDFRFGRIGFQTNARGQQLEQTLQYRCAQSAVAILLAYREMLDISEILKAIYAYKRPHPTAPTVAYAV